MVCGLLSVSETDLPKPPREVAVEHSLEPLAPRFRDAVERVLERMQEAGFQAVVAESIRSNEREEYLYGFGRTYDDGRGIVTHSKDCAHSWHCFGLAVDIVDAKLAWDAPAKFWRALRAAAEEEGLVSGAVFSDPDLPHVQWGAPMRHSPSPNAVALQKEGGNVRVWQEVGAA